MRRTLPILLGVASVAVVGYILIGQPNGPDPAGSSEPTEGLAIVDVALPELAGNAIIGQRIFDAKCAECHGENAAGKEGSGPPLIHPIYRAGHHGDQAFILAARNGVKSHHWPYGNMPPVQGVTDGEVAMVVEFIRSVQQANGVN